MSSIVGGNFKCFLHDFETADVNEWNDHCESTGHTDSGETACIDCQTGIAFTNIPFRRIYPDGKRIQLRCPNCFSNYQSQNIQQAVEFRPNFNDIQQAQQQGQLQQQQNDGNVDNSQNQSLDLKKFIIK